MERINLLMDIYGNLLTKKQRRFVELHFGEDLSFGEIAAQYHVSRQAIYDAVKHALANLEKFEKTLSLLPRMKSEGGAPEPAPAASESSTPHADLQVVLNDLQHLRNKVKKQRIIYNADWMVGDLSRVSSQIEASLPPKKD